VPEILESQWPCTYSMKAIKRALLSTLSSIDMYNNDVGKQSVQKFMKQTGDLKAATLYFASFKVVITF